MRIPAGRFGTGPYEKTASVPAFAVGEGPYPARKVFPLQGGRWRGKAATDEGDLSARTILDGRPKGLPYPNREVSLKTCRAGPPGRAVCVLRAGGRKGRPYGVNWGGFCIFVGAAHRTARLPRQRQKLSL